MFIKNIFWEYDLSTFTEGNYAFFVERILEKGTFESIKWLFSNISHDLISSVAKTSVNISSSTRNVINLLLINHK